MHPWGHYFWVLNLFAGRITAEIRSDSKNSLASVDVKCFASRDSHFAVYLCSTGPLKTNSGRHVTAKCAKISLCCDRREKSNEFRIDSCRLAPEPLSNGSDWLHHRQGRDSINPQQERSECCAHWSTQRWTSSRLRCYARTAGFLPCAERYYVARFNGALRRGRCLSRGRRRHPLPRRTLQCAL